MRPAMCSLLLVMLLLLKCGNTNACSKYNISGESLLRFKTHPSAEGRLTRYRAPAKRAADAKVPSSAVKETLGNAAVSTACA